LTADRISARRTMFGAVELRADPIRDDTLDAVARAYLRDPDEIGSLLAELGRGLRDLDDDHARRLPNLDGIRDDLCTHAGLGYATTRLDQTTARRLAGELADATHDTGREAA
jgi:hypothetical protein